MYIYTYIHIYIYTVNWVTGSPPPDHSSQAASLVLAPPARTSLVLCAKAEPQPKLFMQLPLQPANPMASQDTPTRHCT